MIIYYEANHKYYKQTSHLGVGLEGGWRNKKRSEINSAFRFRCELGLGVLLGSRKTKSILVLLNY